MGADAERRELSTPRSLSLISAKPRILNPGMLSVELAFERLVTRHGLNLEIRRYCLEEQKEVALGTSGVRFACLLERFEEALAGDRVLFWGDFLHAWNYHVFDVLPEIKEDARFRAATEGWNERERASLVRKYLLLSQATPETLAKTLSFGTTLLGDHALIRAIDSGYEDDLARFLRGCRGVWMRDALSALRVAHFRGDYARSHLGVDCALLLSRGDLEDVARAAASPAGPYAAVHFGRTTMHHAQVLDFTRQLCQGAGLRPRWLSWLHAKPEYFRQFRDRIPELDCAMPQDPPYPELLAGLLGANLVITDTYHLSILAWRAGVPVVCIGSGAELPTRTVSDKKKEIFHHMYGASPFYLFAEALVDPRQRQNKLRMMLEALSAGDAIAGISETIARHAAATESELVEAIGAARALA